MVLNNSRPLYLLGLLGRTVFFGTPWRCNWLQLPQLCQYDCSDTIAKPQTLPHAACLAVNPLAVNPQLSSQASMAGGHSARPCK